MLGCANGFEVLVVDVASLLSTDGVSAVTVVTESA